jgi:UDPglucose 6-dehydrogenase
MHTVAVCGTGYVGLVTAACFAQLGNDVVAYDTDVTKIALLNAGRLPFHEPALGAMVKRCVTNGSLRFLTSPPAALAGREIVFIATCATTDLLVVNKSTVPVETVDLVARLLAKHGNGRRFMVASNPEFLREGSAVDDFMHPDRIVIGTDDPSAASLLKNLYASIDAPVIVVEPRTAEMVKYAANAFLATKLSFVNELSNICEAVGANIDVLAGIAYDRRRVVNRRQIARAVTAVESCIGELDGSCGALLGLSFKPDTDDVRDSPAIALARALRSRGALLRVHDPAAMNAARRILRDSVEYAGNAYAALLEADYVIVATPWNEYQALDWQRVYRSMQRGNLFDMRNALDACRLRALGFSYYGVARPGPVAISA